jgi:hypothetical protein
MNQFKSAIGFLSVTVALVLPNPCISQTAPAPAGPQQKIQALQRATAENEKRLHQYQWIETTTVTLKGNSHPPRQSVCRYTPYGTLSKTPIGPQQEPPQLSGGLLHRRIEEKKITKAEQEVASVRELTARYLPMNPEAFKQALQTRRVDFEHEPTGGDALIINDYAKPGDKFILELDAAGVRFRRITIRSYFDSPSQTFVATVQFSTLGDGTNYPSLTTLESPAKHLTISTVSSDFSVAVR